MSNVLGLIVRIVGISANDKLNVQFMLLALLVVINCFNDPKRIQISTVSFIPNIMVNHTITPPLGVMAFSNNYGLNAKVNGTHHFLHAKTPIAFSPTAVCEELQDYFNAFRRDATCFYIKYQ